MLGERRGMRRAAARAGDNHARGSALQPADQLRYGTGQIALLPVDGLGRLANFAEHPDIGTLARHRHEESSYPIPSRASRALLAPVPAAAPRRAHPPPRAPAAAAS